MKADIERGFGRRRFLAGVGAALVLGGCGDGGTTLTPGTTAPPATMTPLASTTTTPRPAEPAPAIATEPVDIASDPFVFGVASGDPTADSVVLWTRLQGDDVTSDVPMVWELASSDAFDELWATDSVTVTADHGHTVRVITSELPAATTMWYRFRVGDHVSPVGRTATLPADDAPVERLRLAVSSCQLLDPGRYAAHLDIAAADLDLVVWLGDFIYESPPDDGVRTLDDYRQRYATYRSQPQLQAAQAAHPWVMTWDDHEVVDDYDSGVDPDLRAVAYRAWWENVPTRVAEPTGDGLTVYHSVDVGDLVRICLVDARQYASESTLLGDEQLEWLVGELDNRATWSILASPVLFGGLLSPLGDSETTVVPYAWDAHADERAVVNDALGSTDSIVVSGDLHTSMVLDVKGNPNGGDEVTVATEFMAPAISSPFLTSLDDVVPLLKELNPQVRQIDATNGWLLVDVSPAEIVTEFRFVDDVDDPDSTMTVGPRFRVAAGEAVAEAL